MPQVGVTLTTTVGAECLQGNVKGLAPWKTITPGEVTITAILPGHGPANSEIIQKTAPYYKRRLKY